MSFPTSDKIKLLCEKFTDQNKIFELSIAIKKDKNYFEYSNGDLRNERPYFIASATKLFISALVFIAEEEKKFKLDEPIGNYLSPEICDGLHVYKGKEYTKLITIEHLLCNTSGLADYFGDKINSEQSIEDALKQQKDQRWTFEEAVLRARNAEGLFIPGQKNKAHYSDTNFQLLGRILENVYNKPLSDLLTCKITEPLSLSSTYLYQHESDKRVLEFFYGKSRLHIPGAMSSVTADGGMVSTARDCIHFSEAYFNGMLFKRNLNLINQEWRRVMFPLRYGRGLMCFKLPLIFSLFKKMPVLYGHSGLSGAFIFYDESKKIHLSGTVNQLKHPEIPYKFMLKVLSLIK